MTSHVMEEQALKVTTDGEPSPGKGRGRGGFRGCGRGRGRASTYNQVTQYNQDKC